MVQVVTAVEYPIQVLMGGRDKPLLGWNHADARGEESLGQEEFSHMDKYMKQVRQSIRQVNRSWLESITPSLTPLPPLSSLSWQT